MTMITIGKREIPLLFNMEAFAQVEEEIGLLSDLNDILNSKERISKLVAMVRIIGNAGLEEANEKADLTDKWLKKNMRPNELPQYQIALMNAITDSMKMETDETDNEAERDVVLEEIQKKSEKDF